MNVIKESSGQLILNEQLLISSVNNEFCQTFSCKKSDLIGQELASLFSPKDRKGSVVFHSEISQYKSDQIIDIMLILRIGRDDFHVRMQLERAPSHWIVLFENISLDSSNILFQFNLMQERWASVVKNSNEGIATLDQYNRLTEFNETFIAFFDIRTPDNVLFTEPALRGKELFSLLRDSQDFDDIKSKLEKSKKSKRAKYSANIFYHEKHLHIYMNPIYIPVSGFVGSTLVIHDITDKKNLEIANQNLKKEQQKTKEACQEAEKANRLKSEFLANMSHELRTPMHGILSFSNFGIKNIDSATLKKLKYYFSNILLSGERLLILLNDLLDLSKLEAGKMEIHRQNASINELIANCELEQQQRLIDLDLTITQKSSSDNITGYFDPARISQVITNILSNAIKFSPQNSVITISVTSNDAGIVFSLTDSGVGIPDNELNDIFTAFIQSSKTRTSAGGTGLGLAISKNIIEAHGGRIWAENNADHGAVFSFTLPSQE